MNKLLTRLSLQFFDSIASIGRSQWNRLSGVDNPFMRYEFLHALECTGCTTAGTGWQPYHVAVFCEDDKTCPVAVMPLYLKTNSQGEYVFDWSWANAYHRRGEEYYPKLVTAAPFTPSQDRRLFVSQEQDQHSIYAFIVEKIKEQAEILNVSSWHVLFPEKHEHEQLKKLGIQGRIATQFHWYNRGYESFDDFLKHLNSRKRKSIRKERHQVTEQGISFICTEGGAISEQQWEDFYLFYQTTYLIRGMQGYLKRSFFLTLAETMSDQLFLINAVKEGEVIAAALFFKNSEKLFGRYWGCREDRQFLHFETCYYQGIDYAIAHGHQSFDSGAQGEHKIQRGFEPIITCSNHWIAHAGFAGAISRFLEEERPHILAYQKDAAKLLPFKQVQS
ncbi:MAG: GNAT family N-acetyltransferase [Gammaproteobacteria bacterium]|nr:GNAT family N-acetyltransferase [Gammaproteobacteria bacterium]